LTSAAAGVFVKGTTPKLTIGDAGAEDTFLVFDGNAQDYRIGLDDGTDKLEFGVGATHGTTIAMTIDSSQQVKMTANTSATNTTSGSLVVTGGVGISHKLYCGNFFHLMGDRFVADNSNKIMEVRPNQAGAFDIQEGGGGGSYLLFDTSANKMVMSKSLEVGVDGTGYDVKFFGDTAGKYMLWDQDADELIVSGEITCTSDERAKDNIKTIENPEDMLNKIKGVEFNWRSSNKKSWGIIAQDIEKIMPEAVSQHGGLKSVNYNCLVGLLIEAYKEQNKKYQSLEDRFDEYVKIMTEE